ncbi:MAG: AAA family ATPase [Deltaproteobacteria bacterium]|nr:AAA family ATPase [Deltaproteobacteria bacterium]
MNREQPVVLVIIAHDMGNHSVARLAANTLDHRLTRVPVVVVVGARQTGKSTLVRRVAAPRRYETLDALTTLDRARAQPESLMLPEQPITIDEVQRAPDLLLAIKQAVDNDRRPGRFLLTGSANLLLMAKVGESLAGRASYLQLRPLTEREKHQGNMTSPWSALMAAKTMHEAMQVAKTEATQVNPGAGAARTWQWAPAALEGGFPPAALAVDAADRSLWFDGYIDTYLQRDLRDLAQIVKSRIAPRTADARAVDAFCEERKLPFGLLLYDGNEVLALSNYTIAMPLSLALGGR